MPRQVMPYLQVIVIASLIQDLLLLRRNQRGGTLVIYCTVQNETVVFLGPRDIRVQKASRRGLVEHSLRRKPLNPVNQKQLQINQVLPYLWTQNLSLVHTSGYNCKRRILIMQLTKTIIKRESMIVRDLARVSLGLVRMITAIPSSGETCPALARGVWLHASLLKRNKTR